jgi:hypothetical protein
MRPTVDDQDLGMLKRTLHSFGYAMKGIRIGFRGDQFPDPSGDGACIHSPSRVLPTICRGVAFCFWRNRARSNNGASQYGP